MGYYCAWGDTKVSSSSEEEGYENHVSGSREKRNRALGISAETFAPVLLIPDDTDRQFWAEDELSNSESRQKLITKRKRRRSMSYRNRAANRSRSQIPHSSSSSSDSICAEISPKIRRRYCRCRLKPETEKLRCLKIRKASRTSIEKASMNEVIPECQVASTSGQQSIKSHREIHQVSSRANYQQQTKDAMRHTSKVQLRRMRDGTKQK